MMQRFNFSRPAPQKPAPQPAAAWSCVLSYDRNKPDSLRLEILGGAQPPAEEIIAVLGLARDALLRQLGAALLQQAQAQAVREQAAEEQATKEQSAKS